MPERIRSSFAMSWGSFVNCLLTEDDLIATTRVMPSSDRIADRDMIDTRVSATSSGLVLDEYEVNRVDQLLRMICTDTSSMASLATVV